MSKERDWVDYAQVALSAAQLHQLGQISGNLLGVSSELARMRQSAEAEERKAVRLNQMRQMILYAERLLDRIEVDSDSEMATQKKFVFSLEIANQLRQANIIPPVEFESWQDKDRVTTLDRRIIDIQSRLKPQMTEDQYLDAQACWECSQSHQDLRRLCTSLTEGEASARKKAQVREKLKELRAAIASKEEQIKDFPLPFHYKVTSVLFRPLFQRGAFQSPAVRESAPEGYRRLFKERDAMLAEISRLQKELSAIGRSRSAPALPKAEVKRLAARFGGEVGAEKLQEMLTEQSELLERILGEQHMGEENDFPVNDHRSSSPLKLSGGSFTVVLADATPGKWDAVARAIHKARRDRPLSHIKLAIPLAPLIVLEQVEREEADAVKRKIIVAGGKAIVEPGDNVDRNLRRL